MGTLYIKNKLCPFCKKKLVDRVIFCPKNISIPCLECKSCKVYLYTEEYYNLLNKLANNNNRKLNHDVYKYQQIEQKIIHKPNQSKNKTKKKKVSAKNNATKSKNKTSGRIENIPTEKVNLPNVKINYNVTKKCAYFKNKVCIYFDNWCNPYSVKCANRGILALLDKNNISNKKQHKFIKNKQNETSSQPKYVKAIVLSHNRKCIYEEHNLITINAIIKVLLSNSANIVDFKIPAVYCEKCNQYIILKTDYKNIKKKGTLMCQVIDKTPEYLSKNKGSYSSTESRVHSLGYNVIKQGYDYSFEQRKIILANIIENYGVTQYEILSMLDTNIARKINVPHYEEAVEKWQQDREFVANYKTGDIPEVIINEIVVGKRK